MMKQSLILIALSTIALAGCAKTRAEGGTDGVTHWLAECETSAECGELECLCGMCTTACDDNAACSAFGASARCTAPDDGSCTAAPQVCQRPMMSMPIEDSGAGDGAVVIDSGYEPRDSGPVDAGEPAVCNRMDARSSGALCPAVVGYAWDGLKCHEVLCTCSGEDCDELYDTAIECEDATSACQPLTMCVENSDCLLQPAECNCECSSSIRDEDVHAVSSSGEALTMHSHRMCGGLTLDCEECAIDRLAEARKRLVPTCGSAVRWEGGACAVTDLTRLPCTEDVGCAVRVARCCQCGPDPSVDELFAMPVGESADSLFCDTGQGCCEGEPTLPDNVTARCGSQGYCQLLLDGAVIQPGNP
jgi:hypothetical protein